MRLQLTLSHRPNSLLSLNYHYALQAVIYKVLEQADPVFSHWLHEQGYDATGKNFKLFTFSELRGLPFGIDKNRQTICFQGNTLLWQISFCLDEAVEKFVIGLFQNQSLEIITPEGRMKCTVEGIQVLPAPTFSETMRYRSITPICISERTATDKQAQYRSPSYDQYEALFLSSLENKYKAFAASTSTDALISSSILSRFTLLSEPRMKGLSTLKSSLERPTKTIGYLFDFELTAPIEWQRLGYFAGFGKSCSGGFGCCTIL